jgi:AraC-like DNA-binding protein
MPTRDLNRTSIIGPGERHKISRDSCLPQEQAIRSGKIFFRGLTHGHYPGTKLPPKVLPGLCSLGFWDAVGVQDWGMEFHRNEGIEIVLLETGRMDFTVEGARYNLSAGDLTITRPWQLHCHGIPHVGPGRLHWLILDVAAGPATHSWKWPEWLVLFKQDFRRLNHKMRSQKSCAFKAPPDVILSFKKLAECLSHADYRRHLSQIVLSINQILLSLLTIPDSLHPTRKDRDISLTPVEKFLSELRRSRALLSQTWTLENMARHCGIGATTLVKYCHDITNTTPIDYLNRCRLEWAAEQLKKTKTGNVTTIAFQAGFSSSSYFATQFRNKYQISPRTYRASFQSGPA